MSSKKISILAAFAFVVASQAAYAQTNTSVDDKTVNAACTADAKITNCTSVQAGHGLIKCMNAYKKANPSFQFTSSCVNAIKTRDAHKKH